MRVYLVAYSHYEKYIPALANAIARLASAQRLAKIVLVSGPNHAQQLAHSLPARVRREKITSVVHDNIGWEFGGYQRGLDAVRPLMRPGDAIIVVNDTTGVHFQVDQESFAKFIHQVTRTARHREPTLTGSINCVEHDARVLDLDAARWVRSCLFAINHPGLEALNWKIYQADFESGVRIGKSGMLDMHELANQPMQDHINAWLISGPSGERWYGTDTGKHAPTEDFLIKKAASILNEKYLSAKIADSGQLLRIVPDGRLDKVRNASRLMFTGFLARW